MGQPTPANNDDKLKETTENNATPNATDVIVHSTSSIDPSDQNSNSGRLQNVDLTINNAKNKSDQKNFLEEKDEEMEKRGKKEAVFTSKSNITQQLPIRLIRRPSEEGFHQVVKFTKHATRRAEAELPERKSFTLSEFSKQGKSSSKKKDICTAPLDEDSTNQKLDNWTICVEHDLDESIQFQSDYHDSADEICIPRSVNASINSHSLNCAAIELKSSSRESICAESRETYKTVSSVEADDLLKLAQEQRNQQEYDGEICQGNCDLQMDENGKLETPTNMQKTTSHEPNRTQVIIKKKRCDECFADAIFNAADSVNQQQQKSLNENRTFIITNPQYCSVSATVSLDRPKKFFINKGKITEKSTATATFQEPITVTSGQQNLDDSKGVSTSTDSKIDRKSAEAKFRTESISPSGNHHLQNSVNNSATAEITFDVPRFDSPHSTLNSRGSGGYRGDCSSVNSLHSTEYKDGMNRRQNNSSESRESLSSRLSRGFLEFTQGSSDRLQKWKNKLQNGRRHKDSSEPPPINRKMLTVNQEQSGHSSDVEVVLDWTTLKCDSTDQIRSARFSSTGSAFALKTSQPNLILSTRSASDLLPTNKNTTSSITLNAPETIMEHRTLKQCDDNGPRTIKNLAAHFQNLKNNQATAQTVDSYDNLSNNLPPPVRITPYSGVKPKGMDIIRPVAFRPYASCKSEKRQAITSSSFSFHNNKKKNDFLTKRLSNSDDLKRSSQQSKDTVSNSSVPSSVNCGSRPRAIYQPSTSSELTSAMVARKSSKFEAEENDYDIVPEYIEHDKFYIDVDSTTNENYSVVHSTPYCRNPSSEALPAAASTSNNTNISRDKIQQQQNGSTAVSVVTGIPSLNIIQKSSSSHQVYGSNASSGSRHSSGIHVTPSPSDSGIVDYETIIRDKENELTNIRATMEQNEEVVVKVYLEKERLWKEQLADLKQKLQASQQGENALRQQIQRCNEEREQFRVTIQNLTSDKQGLQRKCLQIERELFQLRECFDELIRNRDETICGPCRKRITCDIAATNTNNNITDKRAKPPLPTPRYPKELSSERELRDEVEELRDEVSTLRDTLNEQIGLFADERKRWEEERIKILKSSNSPSNLLGLLSTNDSSSTDITSQLSRDLKILTDGKSYIVSRDRLI